MNPLAAPSIPILLLGGLLATSHTGSAAEPPYAPGDLIRPFSLVRRDTGQPMPLSEFAGKIIFLDWFAWWCPFCQAAAPQLLEGIDRWYAARGGNPDGIEVVHVGINLQPNQETQTQNFVTRAGLDLVLHDFDRALAQQFFPQGGQPLFAIINGVTDSPSHRPWELLYHRRGYGEREFPVAEFRAAIDAVKKALPPPMPARLTQPSVSEDGRLGWVIESEPGRTYEVQISTDLQLWTTALTIGAIGSATPVELPDDATAPARFVRVVTR